ncbi:MAG TPA: cation-efflux pump [Candidatus Acidoferrales bacterium]|nr:cation-efflux pump [Candidatus Acidoferrales bacterium]
MPSLDTAESVREKKLAALASISSAVLLVSLKVFLALVTGSLGVLSEALHSGLDFIAAILTYLSVRVSDLPADETHPYGHGKVESFSAFVETGLLLLTAGYIIWEAFQRLFFREVHISPSLPAIAILGLGLGVDFVRSRALTRVARKYMSEALEADALHFSTDVWSTLVVIAGIAMVWLGERIGAQWLRYADPIAALAVAAVIIWVGSRLGKRTLDALIDAAPAGLQQRVAVAVSELEGVLSTERVRVRRAGNRHFVDVTISVPRTASFEQVHAISDAVERRIGEIVPADVMVHMEPRARTGEHLFEAIRVTAQRKGLAVHELSAHQLDGRLFIELHLEVDEKLSLRDAHRRASELEEEIRRLPSVAGDKVDGASGGAEVYIHIEPLGTHIAAADQAPGEMKELSRAVEQYINRLREEYSELVDCHEVRVRRVEHKILVSCHCAMDGTLPITEVHDVTAALEDRVKERFPQIFRVTIHPEPVEES